MDPIQDLFDYIKYDNLKGIKRLVEDGEVDIERVGRVDDYEYCPLQYAVYCEKLEIVKYLLSQGADTKRRDVDDETPLTNAVITGCVEIAEELILFGADVTALDNCGNNIIEMVLISDKNSGHKKMADMILSLIDLRYKKRNIKSTYKS